MMLSVSIDPNVVPTGLGDGRNAFGSADYSAAALWFLFKASS